MNDHAELLHIITPANPAELWHTLSNSSADAQRFGHIGEALLDAKLIDQEQLGKTLRQQELDRSRGIHKPLGTMLVEAGSVSNQQIDHAIACWLGTGVVDATQFDFDPQAIALIKSNVAERESVVPLMLHEDVLVLLMADPQDRRLLQELRFMTQKRILSLLPAPGTLMPAIARAYARPAVPAESATSVNRMSSKDLASDLALDSDRATEQANDVVSESDNTLVRLINSLIEEAIALKASDIHIETRPAPANVRIRLRLDGELKLHLEVESRYRYALVARIKIMANMDISEHRKPQDGKIDFSRFGGTKTELRVVTVPTSSGLEDVVLRLLAGSKALPISEIGLGEADLNNLREVVRKPYGLILVCGPTGSGKTTTLHSLIADINTESRKIWTAEDPIEITQEGLRQVQMNARIGWTFAAAMRTFLRADPDVIMIGEVRDEETARIAIEASLTGHLVLSTLHTNSASESIARLLEIGLDPFNFSDSLLAILAQRLVRRLCRKCVQSRPATDQEIHDLAFQYVESLQRADEKSVQMQVEIWKAAFGKPDGKGGRILYSYQKCGCEACEGRGYKGRLGIYELLLNSEEIRHHIRQRDSAGDIRFTALRGGMRTLRQDGLEKVLLGLTDVSEVMAASNL
jgi:type II secretory ATPase GspE/PulE/Tfp pilus assembly ATPase PilB-like protein